MSSVDFPDHIPFHALKRIGLALLDRRVSGQNLQQYNLIIYYKALLFLANWSLDDYGAPLLQHLEKLRMQYTRLAIGAMKALNFMNAPSLSMLQALITGVSPFCHTTIEAVVKWSNPMCPPAGASYAAIRERI